MESAKSDTDLQESRKPNIRKYLATLRQRWEQHSPTNPFCLAEELEPNLTISEFCIRFLMTQRSRRLTTTPPEE